LILLIVILINDISSSVITDELTTVQSIFAKAAAEILKLENDFKIDTEQLKINRENFKKETKATNLVKNTDVIRLNVGGEIIMTTRQTLTRLPKSALTVMFNDRWEHKLPVDQDGNIFFDFNPILFRHLLDQLQTLDINEISPPSESSLIIPFKKMLRKLDLHQLLSSEKNIITFNVGGHTHSNRQTTFIKESNSTLNTIISHSNTKKLDNIDSDVFLDYDPKLFQHLVNQLRKQSSGNICDLEIPSNEQKISYKRMLFDFGICGK
jgi:hypothetical protein